MKNIIKKLLFREKSSSNTYIDYLRGIGISIGEDVTIYSPTRTFIDEQYPWMITIGNHVRIAEGVRILTHDYSWSVLKGLPCNQGGGGILGSSGYVTIGDNVFIGQNAIITRNVEIGNNVIIGAGSIVTKDCEENGVYVGIPAKKIMSIEEFCDKRFNVQIKEAKELAIRYYQRFGKKPGLEIFHEYFMLFTTEKDIYKNSTFNLKINLCGNRRESIKYMQEHIPRFQNYNEFMRYCFNDKSE